MHADWDLNLRLTTQNVLHAHLASILMTTDFASAVLAGRFRSYQVLHTVILACVDMKRTSSPLTAFCAFLEAVHQPEMFVKDVKVERTQRLADLANVFLAL